MPKALPVLDVSAPVCCAPLAAGAMSPDAALEIALRLKALADPVRVQLRSVVLADAIGCRTSDLAPAVGLTEATVSHHLKQLREAGLIEGTKVATTVFYRANRAALTALSRTIDPACC